jgi:D-sedoheptulose 7-phosphate isomerase
MKKDSTVERQVTQLVEASIATAQSMLGDQKIISTVAKVSQILARALKQGKTVFFFGNGGSAADAQHLAAELVGRFAMERPALPALALSVNGSCITAIGNDYGFDLVFARQLEALAAPGDVAFSISTSGNSPNVLKAIATAKQKGLQTIALTGGSGGKLRGEVQYCICIPSSETPRIQECHILVGHIISELVEREVFKEKAPASGH